MRKIGGEAKTPSDIASRFVGTSAQNGFGFVHKCNPICNHKFVEIMSGTSRLAVTAANSGIPSESYEILRNPNENIFHSNNSKSIFSRVASGLISILWIGITCSSWTRARRGKGGNGFPGPLRDNDKYIWGLPGLCPKDHEKVLLGNKQVRWVAKLIAHAIRHKVPLILENPLTSRLWLVPEIKKLVDSGTVSEFYHCAYGAEWAKPTRLACWNINLASLAQRCSCKNGICDFTDQPHLILSGIGSHSCFKTAEASAYPWKFCRKFVEKTFFDQKTALFWKSRPFKRPSIGV